MADASLRQRSVVNNEFKPKPFNAYPRTNTTPVEVEDQGRIISVLDIFRVIITLIVGSCAFSYYITSGDSFVWNYQPWIFKSGALSHYLKGPVYLTPSELRLYNGSDTSLPIYLSINHTIFDVSASAHTYGPGGSYHAFAGQDATRAFVTGCFADDKTSDLRGAEEIYIPVDLSPDDPEYDDREGQLSNSEKKLRAERERREGKKRVRKEVEKWESFYRDSKKYFEIGKLVGVGEFNGPPPKLCDSAEKGRPKRKKQKAKDHSGNAPPVGKPVL